ncbi:MAG: hypothetical protein HKN44_12705 [Ilumatobacter sp.]|nr:hypothetical protein [Ilumatobacter sp.]
MIGAQRRPAVTLGLVGALAVAAAGCGVDGPDAYSAPPDPATTARTLPPTTTAAPGVTTVPPPAETPPNGEVVQVRSLDNSYRAADIEVVAGTEVWWTNNGRNDHNVLPVDESQDWGIDTEDFTPGDEYRHVFGVPGTYLYYCSIHGTKTVGMVGSVTVLPA